MKDALRPAKESAKVDEAINEAVSAAGGDTMSDKSDPDPKTMVRAADARRRFEVRPARARVAFEATGDRTVEVGAPHSDGEAFRNTLYDALGTPSDDFARRELQRLGETLSGKGEASPAFLTI